MTMRKTRLAALGPLSAAALLPAIACVGGGGDGGGGEDEAGEDAGFECPDGDSPEEVGRWNPVFDWSDIENHMDCKDDPDCPIGDGELVAVHAVHLHTGKVLIWPESEAYLYDWKTQTLSYVPTRFDNVRVCTSEDGPTKFQCETDADCDDGETCEPTVYDSDIFCAGHTHLPDGRVLVLGGNNTGAFIGEGLGDVLAFDPETETWELLDSLEEQRWYPTATPLDDGRVFVLGGTNAGEVEIYDAAVPGGQTSVLPGLYPDTDPLVPNELNLTGILYPFVFQLWDGNVFVGGAEDSVTPDQESGLVGDPVSGEWFEENRKASQIPGGAAVMFAPSKVMKAGGGNRPSARTDVIDLSTETYLESAEWEESGDMNTRRHFANFVILADGTVAAVGGNFAGQGQWGRCGGDGSLCYPPGDYFEDMTGWRPSRVEDEACATNICSFIEGFENEQIVNCETDDDCAFLEAPYTGECDDQPDTCVFVDNADNATRTTEIWHPDSGDWCNADTQEKERMYHSTALLLPDGTVLSTGSGVRQGLIQQQNVEIYEPPYLFRGPRPELVLPQDGLELEHGDTFTVMLDVGGDAPSSNEIDEVALIRLGSTTHQFDMGQRRVPLEITSRPSSSLLQVEVSASAFDLPPGWYMLFVLSDDGVPAVAPYVHVEGI